MKKLFIYTSVVGLATGVVCWWCKKEKSNNTTSKSVEKKEDYENRRQEEFFQNSNVMEEMHQTKSESVQAVYNRHSEAGEMMKEAYSNIMEDFVEDFFDEKDMDKNEKIKETIIDSESVSVMKEIDLISDELNELLK